ncbi:MAG: sulfatase [Puniceicoccaceae bacterium]
MINKSCFLLTVLILAPLMNASEQRPNILFALADDASFPYMSAYGCEWVSTPAFDKVAETGLLFNKCYTPNAKCAPSRSAILTGRNSWQLEECANHWNNFPAKFKTVADSLNDSNYHVGYTGKGWAPGVAKTEDGKRRDVIGKRYNKQTLTPPTRHISNNDYSGNFRDFLDAKPDHQPFFFWYGSLEPHRGYEYQSGAKIGGLKTESIDEVPPFWPDDERVRHDMLDYAFELQHFDEHLGKMLALLEERGELDNTLVVVTADNGMPFPRVKGQAYEHSNHLPMAMSWPDGIAKPGRTIDSFMSFIDLTPTWLQVAEVDQPESGMQPITGNSLVPLFECDEAEPVRDYVLIGKERHDIGRPNDWGYPIRGLVKDGYLLVLNYEPTRWPAGNPETGYLNCDGSPTKTVLLEARYSPERRHYWQWAFGFRPSEELYRIDRDPACMVNLANDPAYLRIKESMHKELVEKLTDEGDPRMFGNGDIFDNYPYADPRLRNYYDKFMQGTAPEARWINASDVQPVEE